MESGPAMYPHWCYQKFVHQVVGAVSIFVSVFELVVDGPLVLSTVGLLFLVLYALLLLLSEVTNVFGEKVHLRRAK